MARGVTQHSSMRDWLKSPPPGRGGGGGKKLSGWKGKDGKGHVDTWLHTKCLPLTVWRHSFPTIIVIEDKKTNNKVAHVWGRSYTCHETEEVLDKMYWRETKGDPASERTAPPERCGQCKLVEYLWQECWRWIATHRWVAGEEGAKGKWVLNKMGKSAEAAGKGVGLDPCAVLFRFVSEASDDENTTVHVGGFCGLFGRDKLPEDLTKAMSAAKISPKEAWKEKGVVKPMSVMCVVDNDKPESGVQISEETKELGEKVKEKIVEVWDGQELDIQKKPYCIRWSYDRSQQMGKQYKATPMMKVKPTARILEAIRGDAPDLSDITTPFNQQSMRAVIERHSKIKLPLDELFPTKDQEKAWAAEDAAAAKKRSSEEVDDAEEDDEDESDDVADEEDEDSEDEDEDEDVDTDDEGEELVKCDNPKCKKPHKISAAKCPHCNHVYEVEEEEDDELEPESEKKPVRSRSEAKAAAKKTSAKKASVKKTDEDEEEEDSDDEDEDSDDEDNQDDGIPF